MMLHDFLDMPALRQNNRVLKPVNVDLDDKETQLFLDWTNIDNPDIFAAVRTFFRESFNTLDFESRFALDERNFNTRLGMARLRANGNPGIGHPNPAAINRLRNDSQLHNHCVNIQGITDREFFSILFHTLRSYGGVGKDTVSDLVIQIIKRSLLDETRKIFPYLLPSANAVMNDNGTIRIHGINLLCVPEFMLSKSIDSTTTYKPKFEYGRLVEHEILLRIARMRARVADAASQGAIDRKAGLRALNKLLKIAEKGYIEELTRNEVNEKIPQTPRIIEVLPHINFGEYLDYMFR